MDRDAGHGGPAAHPLPGDAGPHLNLSYRLIITHYQDFVEVGMRLAGQLRAEGCDAVIGRRHTHRCRAEGTGSK